MIQKWVGDYAREEGVAASRLQRWSWLMIVLAVLDRVRDEHGEPLFLLKGGAAMELRFQLEARTTKDIDTVFREAMPSMLERLDEALQAGWGDFTYERSEPEVITETRSVRLAIKLAYRGKRWGTVQLEVAPAEGRSGDDVETLDAIGIDQFGLEGPERIPCLGIRYQIAQKLHACTAPPLEGRDENVRFHDPIDLILLRASSPMTVGPPSAMPVSTPSRCAGSTPGRPSWSSIRPGRQPSPRWPKTRASTTPTSKRRRGKCAK